MNESPAPNNTLIQSMMLKADFEFAKWNTPRFLNSGEHDRPFYPSGNKISINDELGLLDDLSCDQWLKRKILEKGKIKVLDVACGTGRAAKDVEEDNPGVTAYGLTAGTFLLAPFVSAMKLPKDRIIIGNAAHLVDLMREKMKAAKFDVIYSYQGLPYIPLPLFFMVQQVYQLLEDGGVCFFDYKGSGDFTKIIGFREFERWLSQNGYVFNFTHSRIFNPSDPVRIERVNFQKTKPGLIFPVQYSVDGVNIFDNEFSAVR